MGSVFKRREDREKTGSRWRFAYVDERGRRRTGTGYTDKAATLALVRKLETDADLRRRGVIDARADGYAKQEARPLAEHLADFVAALKGKGNAPRYVQQVGANVARLRGRGGMAWLSDLSPSRVQAALAGLRNEGRSLQTLNHSLRHIKQFSRWLWRDGRVREDPLAHLTGHNVATDRRHDRRALAPEEIARLIEAAERGPTVAGLTGPDRATLYRLAIATGLRASELRSLRPIRSA